MPPQKILDCDWPRMFTKESDWWGEFYLKQREIRLIFSLWLINSLIKQLFEPYQSKFVDLLSKAQ